MIDIKELRVGNVVLHKQEWSGVNNLSLPPFYYCLDIQGFHMLCRGDLTVENIEPIPLTPEILGVISDKIDSHFVLGDYYLYYDVVGWNLDYCDPDDRGSRSIAYPEYLHQLQNLYFAITGTELDTTKDFKHE